MKKANMNNVNIIIIYDWNKLSAYFNITFFWKELQSLINDFKDIKDEEVVTNLRRKQGMKLKEKFDLKVENNFLIKRLAISKKIT